MEKTIAKTLLYLYLQKTRTSFSGNCGDAFFNNWDKKPKMFKTQNYLFHGYNQRIILFISLCSETSKLNQICYNSKYLCPGYSDTQQTSYFFYVTLLCANCINHI